uniref:prostatic steroid-binding protein C1-like n=1 Tax=Arvicanthis niloticus TaxID=61156 RepID=UPI00402B97AE
MRLSLCLLLIVLAVSCYEANAGRVCKAVVREEMIFILRSKERLRKELQRYYAPQKAVEAKLEVKKCVDQISYRDRNRISETLTLLVFYPLQFPKIQEAANTEGYKVKQL